MATNRLATLVNPPQNPSDPGVGKVWAEIEPGLCFPSDYVDFINNYGSGRLADFLVIFNPFSTNENVNFFDQSRLVAEDLSELNASDPSYYNFPLYPAPNGLIAVGVTDNGDYIFWVVDSKKDSDLWGVAIIASRSPDIEYFESNLTSTLAGILSGNLKSDSFPSLFSRGGVKFDPI